jgi:cytochrome c oxidase subunit 2
MRSCHVLAALPLLALAACGSGPENPETSLAARGQELYTEKSCNGCHSVDGSSSVGPTWKGLYGQPVKLSDGSTVVANEAYLRESILQPSAKTVDGFTPRLMETVVKPGSLSEQEVDALVAYIKSLK